MSDHTSGDNRLNELFELARDDGPSEKTRDKMWVGIQSASLSLFPAASKAGGATAAAKSAGILSSKLVLGIALGSSITIGIASSVFVIMSSQNNSNAAHVISATPRVLDRDDSIERRVEAVRPPIVITGHVGNTVELKDDSTIAASPNAARTGTSTLSEHDRLAREARMVSEARGALHRGDAETALRVVRAARSSAGARLVPEELTVEAQALRALGDEAGAKRVEADLAGKFPEAAVQR